MMDLIKKLIDLLTKFFEYKNNKETNDAIKDNKQFQKDLDKIVTKKEKEVDKAFKNNDIDAINKIIHGCITFVIISFLFCGCITKTNTIYIQEEDKVVYMEKDGKPGYWLSETTLKRLIDYKIKWEAYQELKYGKEK